MRLLSLRSGALVGALPIVVSMTGSAPRDPGPGAARLPAIVLVSRAPVPGEPGAIPGLGPHHRAVATGGRLLVREGDGRVRELLPPGALFDVSDPSISPDARRVAFAGITHPDSAWRIWIVEVEGGDPRPLRVDDPGEAPGAGRPGTQTPAAARHDDLDPCWVDDSTLVFASTRHPQRAQYADLPVTNLYLWSEASSAARRITAERNGAEEPAMDWATGRLVFSRWWFNRHRAANTAAGITTDPERAIARDTVNLWQTMELSLGVPRPRLAAADLATRRSSMGYQPAPLADGSIAAVYAANLGLSPRPGGTGIHALSRAFGPARRLAGAIVPGRAGDAYAGTEGLAPPSGCAPAGLPDGRVLFSYSPGARGDFGLYVTDARGARPARVLDLPGTLELDAAPVVRRPAPPREAPLPADERAEPGTFRFHDLDVFGDGPEGAPTRGAAPRTAGARLRFFATLARPGHEGGDSAFLVREVPVGPRGEVDVPGLPAGVPMFEQLVGPDGRVLMTAHGPAHVAGSNAGTDGTVSRCVGCHLGHSTLPARARGEGGARP